MAHVLTYDSKVRQALKAPASVGVDVLLLMGIAGLIAAIAMMFGQAATPMSRPVEINLSLWSLPKYTALTMCRGMAAYVLSLIFTLIYGTIAAHNHKAEKAMVPALDILQSIPVLGFLPGVVLAMMALFPNRRAGLELACIIMIFTSQAWNMTFSFYASVRNIPNTMREAARMQNLNAWQVFRWLEVPASMIGLVWNSMMSMAGGWFVLSVEEAFTLTGSDGVQQNYQVPGLGSYMNSATAAGNVRGEIGAVIAMVLMIVFMDQVIWRPIVVWSQRFKMEETAATDKPHSWVLSMFRHSMLLRLAQYLVQRIAHPPRPPVAAAAVAHTEEEYVRSRVQADAAEAAKRRKWAIVRKILGWIALIGLAALAVLGLVKLVHLFWQLPLRDHKAGIPWTDHLDWLTVLLALLFSFVRVTAALALGTLWTLPAGILIGLSPRWSNRLQPIVQIVASFPAPILYTVVYFGLLHVGLQLGVSSIVLMLLGTQWYVLFNVIAGAMAIPSELREAARVYHVPRLNRWFKLYIPAVFPFLLTGLITAAGGAWNATIVSEYITAGSRNIQTFGLGSMISVTQANNQYPALTAAVVSLSLFVVLVNRLFWKRLYRLAESRFSLNM